MSTITTITTIKNDYEKAVQDLKLKHKKELETLKAEYKKVLDELKAIERYNISFFRYLNSEQAKFNTQNSKK